MQPNPSLQRRRILLLRSRFLREANDSEVRHWKGVNGMQPGNRQQEEPADRRPSLLRSRVREGHRGLRDQLRPQQPQPDARDGRPEQQRYVLRAVRGRHSLVRASTCTSLCEGGLRDRFI
jgi:hypothetical protein